MKLVCCLALRLTWPSESAALHNSLFKRSIVSYLWNRLSCVVAAQTTPQTSTSFSNNTLSKYNRLIHMHYYLCNQPLFAKTPWNGITNISYLDHVPFRFLLIQALCYCSSDWGSDYWLFCRPRPSITGRLRFFFDIFKQTEASSFTANLILFKSLLENAIHIFLHKNSN